MKKSAFWFVIVVIALLPLSLAFAGDLDKVKAQLTPENMAKLEKGEVVVTNTLYKDAEGKSRGKGLAIIMVNKPKDEVWKYLGMFDKYPLFMPRIVKTEYYNAPGFDKGVKFQLQFKFVVTKDIFYHCTHKYDKANGSLFFALDKSKKNDIADTSGGWFAIPHGDKTILGYTVALDTGMAVPKVVQDWLTKKDLPNVVVAMKKWVESGGTYRK